MCINRTQNDAIWGLIALFLTNQIAGNTIDFKMNVINLVIYSILSIYRLQFSDIFLKDIQLYHWVLIVI